MKPEAEQDWEEHCQRLHKQPYGTEVVTHEERQAFYRGWLAHERRQTLLGHLSENSLTPAA